MLTGILTRLTAQCPSFAGIGELRAGSTLVSTDAALASQTLKGVLSSVVASVYAVEAPAAANPPDAIYALMFSRAVEIDGDRVATVVGFAVTLRSKSYEDLMPLLAQVEQAIAASPAAIGITDAAMDYEATRNIFAADLQVEIAIPAVGSEGWPTLLVGAEQVSGQPSMFDNFTRQRVTRNFSFVIVSDQSDIEPLRAELQAALLGWQQPGADHEFEFASGAVVAMPGGLFAWRDVYTDATYIQQT